MTPKQETAMQKFTIDPARMAAADGEESPRISITGQDARHIGRVLRLKSGDAVSMTDGRGTDYQGEIIKVSQDAVDIQILDQAGSKTESRLELTICSAMLKDKKMDGVIRELTQIGVTSWVPFFSQRSVPAPDPKKLGRRLERWRAVARESLKQCRRSCEVDIPFPCSFGEVLARAEGAAHCLAFWEASNLPLALEKTGQNDSAFAQGRAVVLIGPEGGFTKEEMIRAGEAGFRSYSLGPRILRAETAALAAAVLVQYLLGDLGEGGTRS